MSQEITGILHASLLVADTERSRAFYGAVLGLTEDVRPDLPFPGVWYRVGGQQLHLLELPNPDPVTGRPEHGGRDRHVALGARSVEALEARLDAAGVPYTRSRSGRPAIFFRDPDGNALEIQETGT